MPEVKKKPAFKETYYNLEEEEMQALIARVKAGDGVAQQQLLDIFANFLTKWVNLIYYAKYKLSDYDARQFISLYVTDKMVGMYLRKNKLNAKGHKHVNETVRGIHYMVQRYGDEEDIRQTVNMTLFECVSIYKRKESKAGGHVPFSGFLYRYFFYKLKRNVDVFLIDQNGRNTFPLITDEDFGDGETDDKPQGFQGPSEPSAEDLIGAEDIDEFWVIGDTAMFPFDILNMQERQLLKWKYVDGQKSSDIAHRITEHPNTVREHFKKIGLKVREALVAEGLI